MRMNIFKLEEYLSHHEFSASYLLCCSDAESFSMKEILDMASAEEKHLWDTLRLGYTEPQGLPFLRTVIADTLYPSLTKENILCFAGAEDGIFCSLHTLCTPGDHVIVLTPAYQSFYEIPPLQGALVTCLPLREENQWKLDIDEVKRAITPKTRCLVINFPHNPTGQVLSQQELKSLVDLCAAHDLWLFSDEVFRLLGTPPQEWAAPAAEIYPKALSLGVMSKAFGMAGLRIGWIACQNRELLKKIEQTKHYTSICNSAPSEILSVMALKNAKLILARNNQIITSNLQLLDAFFQQYHKLFEWIRPQAGCIGFVKYKGQDSIENFAKHLVQKRGVLLMPGSIYDFPGNYFRLGFGRKNFPEGLHQLTEFLQHENL